MMGQRSKIGGVVLAGGSSTRLGLDKALVRIEGRTLLERVLEVVGNLCDELFVVTSGGKTYGGLLTSHSFKTIVDREQGRGPLEGLRAGLSYSSSARNIVVACDMPFLNHDLISYLVSISDGYDVVIPEVDGELQTLHSVYSRSCIQPSDELLNSGGKGLRDLLPQVRTLVVPHMEIVRHDPSLRSFININTPLQLKRACNALLEDL